AVDPRRVPDGRGGRPRPPPPHDAVRPLPGGVQRVPPQVGAGPPGPPRLDEAGPAPGARDVERRGVGARQPPHGRRRLPAGSLHDDAPAVPPRGRAVRQLQRQEVLLPARGGDGGGGDPEAQEEEGWHADVVVGGDERGGGEGRRDAVVCESSLVAAFFTAASIQRAADALHLISSLEPPLHPTLDVLACHVTLPLLGLVVLLRVIDSGVLREAKLVEVFFRHELAVHPALEVVLGEIPAQVVLVLLLFETLNVFLNDGMRGSPRNVSSCFVPS
ncbi:hypothetical protein THAOC_28196, partial [Thalassiosira oceanica]